MEAGGSHPGTEVMRKESIVECFPQRWFIWKRKAPIRPGRGMAIVRSRAESLPSTGGNYTKKAGLCYVFPRMHRFWNQRLGRVGQTSEHEITLLEMVGVLVGAWRGVV